MPKKRNRYFEVIYCEECDKEPSVIIHEKVYYCPDCYLELEGIPYKDAITNLKTQKLADKLKH